MQLGRGFTAARRRASRLAGLVQIPASCTAKTAIRRRASWLAEKAGVDLISRWPFGVAQIFSLRRLIPSRKGWVCPPPTASEQSGDRQRREKGPPILTAEIGEHERAPRAGESYLTPLRATLRAPPSKWAIKGLFPECRAAGFLLHTFLSPSKKSVRAPWDGKSHSRAVVGASNPAGKRGCACGRTKGVSSGQTIGAVRTAVRSACCLPELRVANRLRRLYPLDTRFPSFPFGNLRASKPAKNPWKLHPLHSWQNGRTPPKARGFPRGKQSACRALRFLVA